MQTDVEITAVGAIGAVSLFALVDTRLSIRWYVHDASTKAYPLLLLGCHGVVDNIRQSVCKLRDLAWIFMLVWSES
jgi:hypothetical protein